MDKSLCRQVTKKHCKDAHCCLDITLNAREDPEAAKEFALGMGGGQENLTYIMARRGEQLLMFKNGSTVCLTYWGHF